MYTAWQHNCIDYTYALHCVQIRTATLYTCVYFIVFCVSLLYASAICIAQRNALHTSTTPYCILFLPVLIAVPGTEGVGKWEGGGGPLFFELIVFSWSVLLGPCSGISETHVRCQFLGGWCRYHLGDQFLFFVCFLMSWSALLFGKSSVHYIDHGYVLDVNFIPYCMYSSHFCSRVFTFFVIFFSNVRDCTA